MFLPCFDYVVFTTKHYIFPLFLTCIYSRLVQTSSFFSQMDLAGVSSGFPQLFGAYFGARLEDWKSYPPPFFFFFGLQQTERDGSPLSCFALQFAFWSISNSFAGKWELQCILWVIVTRRRNWKSLFNSFPSSPST